MRDMRFDHGTPQVESDLHRRPFLLQADEVRVLHVEHDHVTATHFGGDHSAHRCREDLVGHPLYLHERATMGLLRLRRRLLLARRSSGLARLSSTGITRTGIEVVGHVRRPECAGESRLQRGKLIRHGVRRSFVHTDQLLCRWSDEYGENVDELTAHLAAPEVGAHPLATTA